MKGNVEGWKEETKTIKISFWFSILVFQVPTTQQLVPAGTNSLRAKETNLMLLETIVAGAK
jgi:hypothetical protein